LGTFTLGRTVTVRDLPPPRGDRHPVIELMLARAAEGSRRGARSDGASVALAIEGGGLRGVVSAGMCVMLERTDLIGSVDAIFGVSSGALNGSFTAAGQAALGSTNYIDTATLRFANPLRLLVGGMAVNLDLLFGEVIGNRKPYDFEALTRGPGFTALAVDLDTSRLTPLRDFDDADELIAAVRVSCSMPLLCVSPLAFRGSHMADGGLIESIPYRTARAEGMTHVLVLRSRPVRYRTKPFPRVLVELARRRAHPAVAPLMRERSERYNTEAEELEQIDEDDPSVAQIAPPEDVRTVSQLEYSQHAIRDGLRAGASAAASAFGLRDVDLLWQPETYAAAQQEHPMEAGR
jgi:predicted patatin/cPLA2 family phospholipase